MKNIIKHKIAYNKVARKLGCFKLRFYFHDLDKLILTPLIGDKMATKIHRKISSHHKRNGVIKDVLGAIIDWECARFTKPDKPLNASATLYNHYADLKNIKDFQVMLDKLGL